MLKVVITDDEIQVRKGLRMKVDWEEEGFEIVDEASNGQEALEILENCHVDLVITDMRMPIMNGIEFAKQCQQKHPKTKVIVLSGYSDFEYVKNSLKQGVKDYLLKPVAPDELVEVLRKIKEEIEDEKRKQDELNKINRLVRSHLQEAQEQYLLYLVKDELLQVDLIKERLCQLQLDELANEEVNVQYLTVEIRAHSEKSNRVKELWAPFQLLCNEIAKEQANTYSFTNPSYSNIVHLVKVIDPTIPDMPSNFVKSLQHKVKKYLNLETVIGVGSVVKGLSEFKSGYISSLLSWSQSQLGAQSQVIDGTVSNEELFDFSPDFERKLINTVETINYISFKENLNTVLKVTTNHSILSFSFVANRVLFLLGSLARKYDIETKDIQKTLWDCQQSIWELNAQRKVIDYLLKLAQAIIEKIRIARFSNGIIIDSIRQYMDEHYASEISLTFLSELFHINSAYLSETFKNHIGKNFSEYLVGLRMEKAQHFLQDKQLKIIDVANLVGFSNSGYFSTVFKKHFGQTPVEFRKFT